MDRVRGGWTTRNNSLNLIRSRQASTWSLRAACAASVRFRSFIRPSSQASVNSLRSVPEPRVILNACFDAISGRVNNAVRCSRDAWSRVWIRPDILCQGHGRSSSASSSERNSCSESSKVLTLTSRATVIACIDVSRFLQRFPYFFKWNISQTRAFIKDQWVFHLFSHLPFAFSSYILLLMEIKFYCKNNKIEWLIFQSILNINAIYTSRIISK